MPERRGKRPGSEDRGVQPAESDWVILGRLSGLYGVRGWLKVFSDTLPRENILQYRVWYLMQAGDAPTAYRLVNGRTQGKGIVAQLEGISDRDMAAGLLDREICVPREALPSVEDDEYYWADLEGLQVVTVSGVELGVVDHLFETGANDVVVVSGSRERLVPFIPDVIIDVDLESQIMTVDWDPEF